MKRFFMMGCMTVILAACATKPSTEVPVESRSAAAGKEKAADVSTHGMGSVKVDQQALAAQAKAAESPKSVAVQRPAQSVCHFDYDSSALRPEAQSLIAQHVAYLKANKAQKILLQGHADERGSREYNLALGQRRADAVKQAMSVLGIPEDTLEAVSMGEEKPVAEGHDEAAWTQNRRVEMHYR